jgi:hypothetical protein
MSGDWCDKGDDGDNEEYQEVSFDRDSQSGVGVGGARHTSFASRSRSSHGGGDSGTSSIMGGSDISSEWRTSIVRSSVRSRASVPQGKLRFSSLGLFGREKEQKLLHE